MKKSERKKVEEAIECLSANGDGGFNDGMEILCDLVGQEWWTQRDDTEEMESISVKQILERKPQHKEDIRRVVTEIISRRIEVPKDDITKKSHLIQNLGIDSIDAMELLIDAERAFNITITDTEIEKLKTVSDAINLVHNKIKDNDS